MPRKSIFDLFGKNGQLVTWLLNLNFFNSMFKSMLNIFELLILDIWQLKTACLTFKSFLQPLIFSFWSLEPWLVGYHQPSLFRNIRLSGWNFFLFFTQIFLRSNSGCHDGGVGAGYALDIMENWGFGTAPGTIQTQIMLSSCYDFGERIFHAGGHPRTPKGYRFNCRWKYY